jgi:very-short-patch-repair endonuclease
MKNFAKSILNYFAAFNETRFRFSRKLPYDWSNDSFTLDLSVFPGFQKELLDAVAVGSAFSFEIKKSQYTVIIDHEAFVTTLRSELSERLSQNVLEDLISENLARLKEAFPEEEVATLQPRAFEEALREYNLTVRRCLLQMLTEAQDQKIKTLQREFGFHSVPPSSFNPQREVQRLHDDLKNIAKEPGTPETYVKNVSDHLTGQSYGYTIFDLHPILRSYIQILGTQSLYVFFHEIEKEDQRYPLFAVEITLRDADDRIILETPRDLVMLNTPGINNFEFDTVLTTPRACRFGDAAISLSAIERFLQAKYTVSESLMIAPHFRPLVKDRLPSISYRIGLQAVKEEDRRILDYSELITSLETGSGRKFMDLVKRYVDGNVLNTSDEVQKAYDQYYPKRSADSIVPQRLTIPISLNEKQKRILTAVENGKNQIIVVDGPPGTGKSYTICAIVYLANQMGKSVVITSHKKQALDVIDDALTDRFKDLYPRSKPSVLRLEQAKGATSINNLENTLAGPVINAARSRVQDLNHEAVEKDRDRIYSQIDKANRRFWDAAGTYQQSLSHTFDWIRLMEEMEEIAPEVSKLTFPRLKGNVQLDFERINRLIEPVSGSDIQISLDALETFFRHRSELPQVLETCDRLNRMSASFSTHVLDKIGSIPEGLNDFGKIVDQLAEHAITSAPIKTLNDVHAALPELPVFDIDDIHSYDHLKSVREHVVQLAQLESKFLGKFLKNKDIAQLRKEIADESPQTSQKLNGNESASVVQELDQSIQAVDTFHAQWPILTKDYIFSGHRTCPIHDIKDLIERLTSLQFADVAALLSALTGYSYSEIAIETIQEEIKTIRAAHDYLEMYRSIQVFADLVNRGTEDMPGLFSVIRQVHALVSLLEDADLSEIKGLFNHFGDLLAALGISADNISDLKKLSDTHPISEKVFSFMALHVELSRQEMSSPPSARQLEDFFAKSHKLLEYETDRRMSNLLNHTPDTQRIRNAVQTGKRMSPNQAKVLFENLSCIISEPGLISRHFPMESDMMDLLIIDEASQVSIAESISLMLRAKQTIVFGDELQYGAVGAVNVSQQYSEYYFRDILRDYAQDRNQTLSAEEEERLAREASAEPGEEDAESSVLIPMTPGTKEWLKTFSVRTSTLAFAKALTNYSESLNVHFRSFPEIISYSNDFFYRESQIELITNRIRTKPIKEVLRFLPVETQGVSGRNVNLDEVEAIKNDLQDLIRQGYKGSIGVICSFREQAARMGEIFRKELSIHPELVRNHRFKIWFVGDVQGEERDLVYYSFVQDKRLDNADLKAIYPTIGGSADNIHRLKMQRLNVGFSRAKDIMVFVHSMPIGDYSDTRLGDALRHYENVLQSAHDLYVDDETVFDSPAEKDLYASIIQTPFFKQNQDKLRLIAQFEIGKYIREEFHRNIPNYRVDFLLTLTEGGREKSLIIEYDGIEFHTKNPDVVTMHNFDQEYLDYDIERQMELESYGYAFLRINKFSLVPERGQTKIDVLNRLLEGAFKD